MSICSIFCIFLRSGLLCQRADAFVVLRDVAELPPPLTEIVPAAVCEMPISSQSLQHSVLASFFIFANGIGKRYIRWFYFAFFMVSLNVFKCLRTISNFLAINYLHVSCSFSIVIGLSFIDL